MEFEKGKGKHSKIEIEQFDQIFPYIGGVGLFQVVYALLIGKYLKFDLYWIQIAIISNLMIIHIPCILQLLEFFITLQPMQTLSC